MPPPTLPHPSQQSRAARLAGPLGLTALTALGIVYFSTRGLSGDEAALAPVTVAWLLLTQGFIVLAYTLGAIGLGRPLARLLARESVSRLWLQVPLGLALMLSLSHALGVVGLLSGDGLMPRAVAWGAVALGLVLLLDQLFRGPLRPESWPVVPAWSLLLAPGLALLIVAASNPPGALWTGIRSEFGGFDALSYHLQLPKEWIASSRLWPVDHNVYSYLPSYFEAAFMHLGQMQPGTGDPVHRMLGGEGAWLIACQFLHVAALALAALLVARAAWVMLVQSGVPARVATPLGIGAAAIVLTTPWMIVVSSLAYNEAAMLALGAGAVLAAIDTGLSPAKRSIIVALCIGVACGCKPTAMLMLAPLAALLLLANAPVRSWLKLSIAGSMVGLLTLAPWLIRNQLASGNPVFPFAAKALGLGHWTPEQAARYALNHGPEPSLAITDRFMRVFSVDFGLAHPQWAFVPFLALLAIVALALAPRSRRLVAVLLVALLAQWAAWAMLTHGQSRFLIPMILPLALLGALGLGALALPGASSTPRRVVAMLLGTGLVACLALLASRHFASQAGGQPNTLLVGSVGMLSGMSSDAQLQIAPEPQQREFLERLALPEAYLNLAIRPQEMESRGVYLLGDSTPALILGAIGRAPLPGELRSPVIYHTTWDTSPLGAAISAAPDSPAAWSAAIKARGCAYVLVNFDELDRLVRRSRYYDPNVTLERVARWLADPASGLTLERAWTRPGADGASAAGTGRALYRLR
ncbi:MAG: hypothetical protein K2Q20_06000 [Phycisphaerales bacterium]|nr:hypothetical protein [Phycisphaerales bacterium]